MAENDALFIPRPAWLRRVRARFVFLRSGSRLRLQGKGNTVNYHDSLLERCTLELFGSHNRLDILPGTRAWEVTFRLIGNNLHCRIGPNARLHGGHYILEDEGSTLGIGQNATIYAPTCVVNEGGNIRIGDNCMFAYGSDLRNSDGHSILNATTRERINPARDIRLGNHVWIGSHCQLLKGVTIGDNSIVAARSVVTKDVAPGTLVAGVPARVIRENVDWDGRRL